jgi:hypothetical protein
MFRAISSFTSRITARRVALAAVAVALVTPIVEADSWWKRDRGGRGGGIVIQPRIVIGGRHHHGPARDMMPMDLKIEAYRSRDTVMLFVTGSNRTSGFTTALTGCDTAGWSPTVTLRNTPGQGACADVCTAFSLNAALRLTRNAHCIQVRVADRTIDVPIREVQSLS